MNPAQTRGFIPLISFLFGSTILFFYAALFTFQSINLLFGGAINNIVTIFSFIGSICFFVYFGKRHYRFCWKDLSIGLLVLFLLFTILGSISSYIIDVSWDGRDYQQKAIRKLASGWNPVYSELTPKDMYYNAWLNHYPKAPWISAASLVKLMGDSEIGKIFNFLLISAVFFISISFLLSQFPQIKALEILIISIVLAANPVSIYQSLTYYVDGQVSSIIILLILVLLMLLKVEKVVNALLYLTVIFILIIGLNIKFTGTAYIVFFLAIFSIVRLLLFKRLSSLHSFIFPIVIGTVLALTVAGFNPYLTNTINYGNPVYPVYGSSELNKDYIISNQMPSNFIGKSQIEKLFLSIFSRSQNTYQNDTGPLKNPFSVEISEIKVFKFADVRVGGWGPLFGALLCLSLGFTVTTYYDDKKIILPGLGLMIVLFASSLLNPETWWARYTPQLWLIPVIPLVITLITKDNRLKIFGYIFAFIFVINIFFVTGAVNRKATDLKRFSLTEGIYIILAAQPNHNTGGEYRAAEIIKELLQQNYLVTYVYKAKDESTDLGLQYRHPNLLTYSIPQFSWDKFINEYGKIIYNKQIGALIEFPLKDFLPIIEELQKVKAAVCYDCLDDWNTQLGSTWYDKKIEECIASASNVLAATAPILAERLEKITSRPVSLVPNAVNLRLFNYYRPYPCPEDLPRGSFTIAYIGALWGDWFNWELLVDVATAYPDAAVMVIGDYRGQCPANLPNLHFLGLKPQKSLPAYLAHTDVAIIPWKENEITFATSPLKLYEYLAMHVPVVVPNLPLLKNIPYVFLSSNKSEFIKNIEAS